MTGAETAISEKTPLLKIHAFRLMFTTRLSSHLSSHFLGITISWQIWKVTESALHLGLVGLAQFLPPLVLSLLAGQIADRYDRRVILRCCYVVQACTATLFLLLTILFQQPSLTAIYVLLTVNATARAFEGPAIQALLPAMVPRDVLGRAIAMQSSTNKIGQLGGPPLAGALLALYGVDFDYIICMILCLTALGATLVMPSPLIPFRPSKGGLDAVLNGLRFIWHSPAILGAISLDLVATFFGNITALLPIFADDVLNIGPTGFGILRSAPGVGGLLMALVLARYPIERNGGKKLFASLAVYATSVLAFGLSENVVLSLALLMVFGAADMVNTVIRQTYVQVNTPDEMRGRVGAVSAVSVLTGSQLGQFRAGLAAVWFGAVGSIVIGGVAVLLMVAIWAKLFPALRNMQKPDEVELVPGRRMPQ
jgi:MFS family permease